MILKIYDSILHKTEENKKFRIKLFVIYSILLYVLLLAAVFAGTHKLYYGTGNEKRKLIYVFMELFLMHIMFDIKKMYAYAFRFRYLVGLAVLLFLSFNKFHGDSMSIYDSYIEAGQGTVFNQPLLGQERYIRTDEWVISTPSRISSSFGETPYGKYNDVLRGGNTVNGPTGIRVGLTTLGKNFLEYGFGLFGPEIGFSFLWFGQIIMTFLMTMELCYIIGRKNKLLAVLGAFLVTCSSFYLWWGFPMMLWPLEGALCWFYYFINSDSRKKRLGFAALFAIFFATFVNILYPAWQIPFGYVALCLAIWMMVDNFEKIKQLKLVDYVIFVLGLCLSVVMILGYLMENVDYISGISNTVYPGFRLEKGFFNLFKPFWYLISPFYAYKDIGNTSECGVFLSFFPMPIILGICYIFKKGKKLIDKWFYIIFTALLVPFVLYCWTGLPMSIAKCTMLSMTLPYRLVDAIGYICILMMIRLASEKEAIFKHEKIVNTVLAIICIVLAYNQTMKYKSFYLSGTMMAVTVAVHLALMIMFFRSKWEIKRIGIAGLIVVSIFTGIYVRPLMKGFDVLWEKPVSKQIAAIREEDPKGRWIVYSNDENDPSGKSFIYQGFLVANGVPTVNSVSSYPNLDMWHAIDPAKQYEYEYNRYFHFNILLTTEPTNIELLAPDNLQVHLNANDLKTWDINYIFSDCTLPLNILDTNFDLIYDNAGIYIYKVY